MRKAYTPDLSRFRRVIFWDTRMDLIDWEKHAPYIIRRITEKGNEKEKNEMIRFYGREKINEVLTKKKK